MIAHKREPVLSVRGLSKMYGKGCPSCQTLTGPEFNNNVCPVCSSILALHDISFDLYEGEILGIVGESGSGKSSLVQCLYFDQDATSGEVYLAHYNEGKDNVLNIPASKKRYLRNHLMGMVYQNPVLGLKLNISSGGNIAEKLLAADLYIYEEIRERGKKLLEKTEIPMYYMDEIPKKLSGGMQQRVQIAKALANNPPLLLLDEVTTGLDVSVQARVLDLIKALQQELQISMIVVSHDLGVIRLLTNRTLVLKNGRLVEVGLTDQIMEDPQHAYSQLLVHSML
ncbi:MAG: Nickel-transporting ATPase [Peptococcaceae bacterium]|jgi:putative phosphonate transport system ATP-binding protein|nr:Nickel-transporting ATPase [Peptococcaceae bacterium]